MHEEELDNIPPEVESELVNFYQMSTGEEEEQIKSPIYSELEALEQRFADKHFHAMGGMKKICTVNDLRSARPIAMAELKDGKLNSDEDVEQFLREARITAALDHPNIVPVYDMGLNEFSKPYFVMKFLKDESLKKILRELLKGNPAYTHKYKLSILLDIFLKVCDAVAFAHSCNVIHLDLKPDNIMIGEYGEVYVCDWGLAKLLDSADSDITGTVTLDHNILNHITLSGVVKGTPGFMAPEQIDDKFGVKNGQTDIYALGAILYSLLTYKKPFAGLSAQEIVHNTVKGKLSSPVEVSPQLKIPESLNAICMKAMSINQNRRYRTVEQMVTDVRAYQEGFATQAEDASFFKALWLLLKRHRFLSIGVFFVALIISGFFTMMRHNEMKARNEMEQYRRKYEEIVARNRESSARQIDQMRGEIAKIEKGLSKAAAEKAALIAEFKPLTISLNLTDGGPGFETTAAKQAGLVERGYWENVHANYGVGSTVVKSLRDSDGKYTKVAYRFETSSGVGGRYAASRSGYNTETALFSDKMMENWTEVSGDTTITFSGLERFASKYDVIIYTAKNEKGQLAGFAVGDLVYFSASNSKQTGPFKQSEAKNEEEGRENPTSNYVYFSNLAGDKLEIKVKRVHGWAPICGIQIVQRKAPVKVISGE